MSGNPSRSFLFQSRGSQTSSPLSSLRECYRTLGWVALGPCVAMTASQADANVAAKAFARHLCLGHAWAHAQASLDVPLA